MSNNYPHPIIAREGWPYMVASFSVALAVTFAARWPRAAVSDSVAASATVIAELGSH